MCEIPKNAGDDCFPKWFRELFDIYMDDAGRAKTIAEAIECSWMFDIAKVLFYHVMKKKSANRIVQRQTWENGQLWLMQ